PRHRSTPAATRQPIAYRLPGSFLLRDWAGRIQDAVFEIDRAGVFDPRALIHFPVEKPDRAAERAEEERCARHESPGMAPDPFDRAHHRRRRFGQNALVLEVAPQIFRERRRAFVTVPGI